MFTVKHIKALNDEWLHEVKSVRFTPGNGPRGPLDAPPTVWISDGAEFDNYPLTGGTVFVMNTNGKTVAHYDLGPIEPIRASEKTSLVGVY